MTQVAASFHPWLVRALRPIPGLLAIAGGLLILTATSVPWFAIEGPEPPPRLVGPDAPLLVTVAGALVVAIGIWAMLGGRGPAALLAAVAGTVVLFQAAPGSSLRMREFDAPDWTDPLSGMVLAVLGSVLAIAAAAATTLDTRSGSALRALISPDKGGPGADRRPDQGVRRLLLLGPTVAIVLPLIIVIALFGLVPFDPM